MFKRLIIGTSLLALASCARQATETIHYTAYHCTCTIPDGFGLQPSRAKIKTDTGSATIHTRDVIRRSGKGIKVHSGNCTYVYALQVN